MADVDANAYGKVLVVGMDGLRFDRLALSASAAPVLHGLMAAGAHGTSLLPYGKADGQAGNGPSASMAYTDSGPGWSSVLTGVWPDRHGVTGNDFTGADYTRHPDFLSRAVAARPGLRTAAAVSWPELVRRGVLGPAIGRRVYYDGESDGYASADRRVADTAARWLTEDDPDVVFVYFGATDEAGHATGPLSPAYARALLAQDAHLGRLLGAIDARRSDPAHAEERWTVLVTTDHGHLDSGGHGGDTRAEREVFVILAEPGGPAGTRLDSPRLIDIAPTVLDRLGIPVDPARGLRGRVLPRPAAPNSRMVMNDAPLDPLIALRPWEAPEVTSWGRLPMNAVDRRAGAHSLDGDWRFQLLPAPDAPLGEVWSSSYVPGVWTMQGTDDLPRYLNIRMPFAEFPPQVPAANPTGVYERAMDMPAEWAGQRIVLQVGAAESVLLVHVDGRPVGISKDSHLAAEFDLTGHVHPGERATLRLTVVKWSDASHIEDQDHWWHGGITRSVLLYARDPLHLADVAVRARRDGDLRVDCRVRDTGGALPEGWYVSGELDGHLLTQDAEFDRAGAEDERVSDFLGEARLRTAVPDVRTWTAETPELYDLTVRLHRADGTVADTSHHRIGFRDVEISGRDLLVNGERVFIRGVNRHDFHPLTGRTVSYDDMRADLVLLKRFGFNAIRTAHYPNDPSLYDLADELGFYVVDEADLESHDHAHEIADDPRYLGAFVDRVARMVLRDKNHPSVIIWSLGNESDYGANHDAAAGWVRRHDPARRPVQYEGAAKLGWADPELASDIACPMYAPLQECLAHAMSGTQTKPLIQCEYSHAMGNSNGTLADHWEAIEATPGLQGGFIWEFWDHGILQRVNDGRPAGRGGAGLYDNGVAAPGHRWAYGGDFGETDHDGAFIADGVVFPDRTPKPVMFEHREIAAPVRIECFRHEGVVLGNHQHFRGLDWLSGEWELSLADGGTLTAPAELPDLRPGETAAVPLPFELPEDGGEAWLTLRVTTAGDEAWAPRGTVVCLPQVRLRAAEPVRHTPVTNRLVEVDEDGLLVHPLLAAAPTLSLWRAPTDNDELGGMAGRWRDWGLEAPTRKVVAVRRDPGRVAVVADHLCPGGTVRHEQVFTAVEGGLLVEESAELPEALDDVARVGSVFETVAGLNLLEWFGQGPWESYPDRGAGAPVGHHGLPVDELFTPYLRPQESGGRHGVRRFTLSAPDATGLAVRLDRPCQVSVTRHRAADLASAAHHDELVPRAGCVVHIDAAHRGLGTASCGPDTFASYLVAAGVHRWSWTLRVL